MKPATKLRVITPQTPLTAQELARKAIAERNAAKEVNYDVRRLPAPEMEWRDDEKERLRVVMGQTVRFKRVSWWGRIRSWLS